MNSFIIILFIWLHSVTNVILVNTSNVSSEYKQEVEKQFNKILPSNNFKINYICKKVNIKHREKATYVINKLHEAYSNTYVIGLTNKDITMSVHGYKNYGVRGCAVYKLKSCIASTYRIPNKKIFCIHCNT